jgi:hypothetical protein
LVQEWINAMRFPIALLVAPLAAPVVVLLLMGAPLFHPDGYVALFAGIATAVAYFGTMLFGLPLFAFFVGRGRTEFWIAIICGFAVGAIAMGLVWAILGFAVPAGMLIIGGLSGAAVGTVLWLITRPDRWSVSQASVPGEAQPDAKETNVHSACCGT